MPMSEFVDLDHARALDDVDGHRLAVQALDGPRMGHVLGVHALDGDMPLHGIVEFMSISPIPPSLISRMMRQVPTDLGDHGSV